jgi:hypothetical protein
MKKEQWRRNAGTAEIDRDKRDGNEKSNAPADRIISLEVAHSAFESSQNAQAYSRV